MPSTYTHHTHMYLENITNKFALLWGEAQLCLPYVCLIKKIAYSYPKVTYNYPKVTYCYPRVTFSEPKVTYSDPRVTYSDPTHLPLPPPISPDQSMAIS